MTTFASNVDAEVPYIEKFKKEKEFYMRKKKKKKRGEKKEFLYFEEKNKINFFLIPLEYRFCCFSSQFVDYYA